MESLLEGGNRMSLKKESLGTYIAKRMLRYGPDQRYRFMTNTHIIYFRTKIELSEQLRILPNTYLTKT